MLSNLNKNISNLLLLWSSPFQTIFRRQLCLQDWELLQFPHEPLVEPADKWSIAQLQVLQDRSVRGTWRRKRWNKDDLWDTILSNKLHLFAGKAVKVLAGINAFIYPIQKVASSLLKKRNFAYQPPLEVHLYTSTRSSTLFHCKNYVLFGCQRNSGLSNSNYIFEDPMLLQRDRSGIGTPRC